MGFTDFLDNRYLDTVFGGVPLVIPPIWYVGISLAKANKQGIIHEPNDPSYHRVAVPNDNAHWKRRPGEPVVTNAKEIIFPLPTIDWGRRLSIFLADAPTGGNIYMMADTTTYGPFDDPPTISAGAFFIQMS